MANKLVTVQQLDKAVDGFASAVAAAGYEKKTNLKKLAYEDDVTIDVMATDLKTLLEGKMTQTKAQQLVNQNVGKAYKPGGSKTLATLPALTEANFGHVYHMTDEFTTTADFIEGAGKTYTAGTEVAIVEVEETLAPGTYDANGDLLKSWAQLVSDGDVMVTNGTMSTPSDRATRFANVEKVVIDSSVTSIGKLAFPRCTGLTTITIPDGVTTIGISAFQECTNLTTITIPNSVTSIGVAAFVKCASLTSITIPDSVTTIGNDAFQDCTNLTTIHYSGTAEGAPWGAPNATVDPNAPAPTSNVTYKYNVLSSYIDTTKFASQSSFSVVQAAVQNIQIATNSDIQTLIDGLNLDDVQLITVDTNKITDDELNPDKISYIASNDQNAKTVYIPASKNWSPAINSVIIWGMSKDGETEINVTPTSYSVLTNTIFDGNWDTVAAVLNESDYNNVMENEENIKVTFDTAGSDNSDG